MWGIFCSNTYFPAHRFSLSSLYVCFCFAYPCTLHEIYYIFHILLSIQFYFFGILYIFIFAFLYIFMFTVILPILKYFWQKISEIIVTSEILIKYRRLRNATSRINTAFFVTYKQITPHRIWYNRVD